MKGVLLSVVCDDHAEEMARADTIAADNCIDDSEEAEALRLLRAYRPRQAELNYVKVCWLYARQVECLGVELVPDKNLAPVVAEALAAVGEARAARRRPAQAIMLKIIPQKNQLPIEANLEKLARVGG